MPQIRFAKNRAPITVDDGVNLMEALLEAGIAVASSCGGDGVCAKCRLKVLDGGANLSAETDLERHLRERHEIPAGERISCQAFVSGDIMIDASYW